MVSTLPSIDKKIGGYVIVIDDVTEMVQAQLNAAWSDVARRLAHEIKNPFDAHSAFRQSV